MTSFESASRPGQLHAHVVLARSNSFQLDVSILAVPGEMVAILGPNGSGKSTLLAALAGLLPIDSGEIRLGSQIFDSPESNIFLRSVDRRVGVVFQDLLLFPHLSVLDNIAFGLRARGVPKGVARAQAQRWAEVFGVAELIGAKATALSGGQAQRVALARALAVEPTLLLLDEPLSALDVESAAAVLAQLNENLISSGTVGVLVTHDPQEAYLLAETMYIIESGRITQHGAPKDVFTHPATAYVRAASEKVRAL